MKVIKKTIYTADDFELNFEPIEDSIIVEKTKEACIACVDVTPVGKKGCSVCKGKGIIEGYSLKYLSYDTNPIDPFEENDYLGNFYHWKDYGQEQLTKYCELLGYDIETRDKIKEDNPLAVRIDKYEHSGISYSVSGEGMQCKWDTSNTWAVWCPNDCLMEDIKRFKSKAQQRKRAIELARQACETFNAWANGEVYLIIKENYDKDKNSLDYDCCGGYFGYEYAKKSLKTDI